MSYSSNKPKNIVIENILSGTRNAATGISNLMRRSTKGTLRPRWLVFEVTDRCNSRCTHCNIWNTPNDKNPITADEIIKAFADPLFKDLYYIQITGGEPVLRKDLEEIFLGIHKVLPKAIIQLSTNALLPDRVLKIVRASLEAGITICVGVSIDGIGTEHDKIRGVKGNFNKADHLLKELVKLRQTYGSQLKVSGGIVISDLTLHSLEPVREYAKKIDIDLTEAWYNECSFYGNEGKNDIKKNLTEAIRSQAPSPLKDLWLKDLAGESIKFTCFAMHTFCLLKWSGDIVPCLTHFNSIGGNIRKNTPTEIWHSKQMQDIRTSKVDDCKGCLNSWGAGWSFESSYYKFILFYLKHPGHFFKALLGK